MQSAQEKMKLKEELKEAGFGKQTACAVIEKLENGDEAGAMVLLDAHRKKLLRQFHKSQECIDCVDYLVYQLQKKDKNNNTYLERSSIMPKKVFILSTTPRKGGNSEMLAQAFADGAKDAGNDVEIVSLRDKNLLFCKGCLACQKTGRCILKDDAAEITNKMMTADVLVFATPIYYYSVSGQMKTMLDRSNPLYGSDYKFRDVYLLTTAAENAKSTPQIAEQVTKGFVDCFGKARLAGSVFAGGVTSPGDIQNHPALKTAYDAGKAV